MAIAGKNARLKVSTTAGGAGVYTTAVGITEWTLSHAGGLIDVSAMGDTYVARIQGLKDVSLSFSGNYEAADTTGQNAIRTALTSDSEIWFQALPDGTAGFKFRGSIERYDISASVTDKVGVSGSIALHSGTLAAV